MRSLVFGVVGVDIVMLSCGGVGVVEESGQVSSLGCQSVCMSFVRVGLRG